MGKSVQFIRVPELLAAFVVGHATASFKQVLEKFKKIDLLILDDWGIEPFDARGQNDMLELIESRIGSKSIIITSQTPMDLWHDLMPSKAVADAVMDRLIYLSHSLKFSGESLRSKYGLASGKPSKSANP